MQMSCRCPAGGPGGHPGGVRQEPARRGDGGAEEGGRVGRAGGFLPRRPARRQDAGPLRRAAAGAPRPPLMFMAGL